jgi:hypothetical protein
MCSYCLARFVPFSTPRGGMSPTSSYLNASNVPAVDARCRWPTNVGGFATGTERVSAGRQRPEGDEMYIGGGVLALIIIILLLIWLF